MGLDHHFVNDTLVIDVPDGDGRLVDIDLSDFIDEILSLVKSTTKDVALNMSAKSYLNSSGLGELIKVKDSLMDKEIDLILINPTPRVESLIDMAGVDQFINIVSSEEDLA